MIDWDYISGLDFGIVWEYRLPLFRGFLLSLVLMVIATVLGFSIGTILAIGARSKIHPVRWLIVAYVEFWRNTPLIVQLVWIHFALPLVTGISTTALQSGLIGLSLNTAAYYSEIVRAGIDSIPSGQWEAADSLGLPKRVKWMRVILPQAIKIIVPPMTSMVIGVFKGTAILSILAVNDLMKVANTISNFTFKPVEIVTAAAIIYFMTGSILSWASRRVEKHFQKSER